MAKKKLKWVVILLDSIGKRRIWINIKDIKDIKPIQNISGHQLYQVILNDGNMFPQCEFRNKDFYENFIQKDLTKTKENDTMKEK